MENHLESLPQSPRETNTQTSWESVAAMANEFRPPEANFETDDKDSETENSSEEQGESLSDRIYETAELAREIKDAELSFMGVENLMTNFGLEGLSRNYGLENTLAVVSQESRGIEKGSGPSSRDVIKNIYNRIEPDPGKRRDVYAEMIDIDKTDERDGDFATNNKNLLAATVRPDKHGNMIVERTAQNESVAYDGLRGLNDLVEQINDSNSPVFGEIVEQAKAEGKSPIAKLVEGIEGPSLADMLGRAEKLCREKAKIADEQIEAQKAEIEAAVDKIEQDILDEVREEVRPFEESRSELVAKMYEMDDEAGRAILEDASKRMYDLVLNRTREASAKFHQEEADYYASLGDNVKSLLTHDAKRMKELANRPPLYGSKRSNR